MSLSPSEIRELLRALQDSEWDDAQITVGDVTISVGRNGAAPAAAPVAAAPAPTPAPAPAVTAAAPAPAPVAPAGSEPAAGDHVVTAPSVGVVWHQPAPGQPPFVEVGSTVAVGDTLCIVEVMKLMNNVTSTVAGVVTAVLSPNGTSVESGAPLFAIKPE